MAHVVLTQLVYAYCWIYDQT